VNGPYPADPFNFAISGFICVDVSLPQKVDAFTEWLAKKIGECDTSAILDWKNQAPFAADNHPTDEHPMPLFFALGAGGPSAHGRRAHHSTQFGFFTNDSWLCTFDSRIASAKAIQRVATGAV
jgi:hypothetical protein